MGVLLDIISATFIGGFLLIIMLTATDTVTIEFFNYSSDAIVQNNLGTLSNVMQHDVRKMGYNIPESEIGSIIPIHAADHLQFLAHLNSDRDYYSQIHGNLHTDNIPDTTDFLIIPNETIVYYDTAITTYKVIRTIKVSQEQTSSMLIGVVGNPDVFRYLDQNGNETAVSGTIKMIEVTLTAFDPRVVLSREYVHSQLTDPGDSAMRKKELRRLLRASYWRQTRLVSKNLRR